LRMGKEEVRCIDRTRTEAAHSLWIRRRDAVVLRDRERGCDELRRTRLRVIFRLRGVEREGEERRRGKGEVRGRSSRDGEMEMD
jgi:hypothetical protein